MNTNVTALVTDAASTNWANGSYTITFVPVPGDPGPYLFNGVPFFPQAYTGNLDAGGNLAITLPSNTSIFPSGTKWQFTVSPLASSSGFTAHISITGASQNISAQLSPPAIEFFATPLAYGYSDAEVEVTPGQGQLYYNVGSAATRQWTGSFWQNIGGGGGSITLTTTGTTGAASFLSGTLNIPIYQGQLTVTTTGTSGPATLVGNTLNIPQYTGGSSSGVSSLNTLTGALAIVGGANLTVAPSGSDVTLTPNVTGLVTPGTNVTITGSGTSGSPYIINSSGSGGSTSFSALGPGVNTSANMEVGSGAAVTPTGTGTVQANVITGTVIAGTGITITGAGVTGNPYVISIGTVFSITSFTGGPGATVETGASFTNPSFTAAYSVTPASADITNTDSIDSPLTLTTPFTSGTVTGTFTLATAGASVTFTLSATQGTTQTASLTTTAADRIFSGTGTSGGATGATASGTSAVLVGDTGTLPSFQLGAETIGTVFPFAGLTGQFIYLLLTGGSHTFVDALTGFPFAMNAPTTVSFVNQYGTTITMYLYQATNGLFGNYSPKVST